jgi:hypothetical protein
MLSGCDSSPAPQHQMSSDRQRQLRQRLRRFGQRTLLVRKSRNRGTHRQPCGQSGCRWHPGEHGRAGHHQDPKLGGTRGRSRSLPSPLSAGTRRGTRGRRCCGRFPCFQRCCLDHRAHTPRRRRTHDRCPTGIPCRRTAVRPSRGDASHTERLERPVPLKLPHGTETVSTVKLYADDPKRLIDAVRGHI